MNISVVLTVRNEKECIRAVIDSLLAQRRTPDEVIVVDGASTDGTLEILQIYARRGQIVLISCPCNIAQGRNLGIAQAKHDYIAVTDAGCVIDPDWLMHIERCFQGGAVDVVAGNYRFDTRTPFERAVVLATESPNRENTEAARYYPSSRSIAFQKTAWAAVKGYPEWLYAAEDTLFNIRLRQLGFRFAFCRDAIVVWRPRQTWKALFKQFFNYARGNGRVGIGTLGYLTNLQYHGLTLFFLLAGAFTPLALLPAILVFVRHVQRHLWSQASLAAQSNPEPFVRWRVLAIMEVVRIAGMLGFLAGRWDRLTDPRFITNQKLWMGVSSLDELPQTNGQD